MQRLGVLLCCGQARPQSLPSPAGVLAAVGGVVPGEGWKGPELQFQVVKLGPGKQRASQGHRESPILHNRERGMGPGAQEGPGMRGLLGGTRGLLGGTRGSAGRDEGPSI